jgi:hypothetical protein
MDDFSRLTPKDEITMTESDSQSGSILVRGLGRVCRNWRCLTWTFALNLLLGAIATIPYWVQTSNLMDHSLASSGISGRLNLGMILEEMRILTEHPTGSWNGAFALDVIFALVVFIITPGVLSIYLGDEIDSFGNMLRTGLRYFWRFVRLTLFLAIIAGIPLVILGILRNLLLNKLDEIYVEREFFIWSLITGLIVAAVFVFFRLWFDLAEVIVVDRGTYRLGREEDRRVRYALGPSWRVLRAGFWRLYLSFIFVGFLGYAGLLFMLALWHMLPPGSIFLAFILAQAGLFLLMAARFWQRGIEVAWFDEVGALVTPIPVPIAPPVVVQSVVVEEVVERDPWASPEPDSDPDPDAGEPERDPSPNPLPGPLPA